jgi:hypothetical protein
MVDSLEKPVQISAPQVSSDDGVHSSFSSNGWNGAKRLNGWNDRNQWNALIPMGLAWQPLNQILSIQQIFEKGRDAR